MSEHRIVHWIFPTILMVMLSFSAIQSFAAEENKWLMIDTQLIDDQIKLFRAVVIEENTYYSNYFSPDLQPHNPDYYLAFYKDGKEVGREKVQFYHRTLVKYDRSISSADTMKLETLGRRVVEEMKLSFCDNDGICEPCSDDMCTTQESFTSCGDCGQGANDGFCQPLDDGICDLDCITSYSNPGDNRTISTSCPEEQLFNVGCGKYSAVKCDSEEICDGMGLYIEITSEMCCQGRCIPADSMAVEPVLISEYTGDIGEIPDPDDGYAVVNEEDDINVNWEMSSGLWIAIGVALVLVVISSIAILLAHRNHKF